MMALANFLIQAPDWVDGIVILIIVVFSAIGSLGKWIVRKIEESRERLERDGTRTSRRPTMRPPPTLQPDELPDQDPSIRPFSAPVPPKIPRPPTSGRPVQPPVMERVFEVLIEQATGKKIEHRGTDQSLKRPPPPPARPQTPAHKGVVQKRTTARPAPSRPQTIAVRENARQQACETEVERETKRIAQREQQWTDDTDRRLGHVETHIPSLSADEMGADAIDLSDAFDNTTSLRRALVLSEILAPPLALRNRESSAQ